MRAGAVFEEDFFVLARKPTSVDGAFVEGDFSLEVSAGVVGIREGFLAVTAFVGVGCRLYSVGVNRVEVRLDLV